jgi:hypothetical protein
MQNFVDTSVFKGIGFKSYDNDDGPANGLANIGPGEMHGEVTGTMTNRFGIKRMNIGDGVVYSFAPKDEWNRKWVDGNLDQCMDQCKYLFTTVMHRAVSIALLGCPLSRQSLSHFIQSNVVFPFNMIYDVSIGVCMKSGNSTGETLIGHADFQLGRASRILPITLVYPNPRLHITRQRALRVSP